MAEYSMRKRLETQHSYSPFRNEVVNVCSRRLLFIRKAKQGPAHFRGCAPGIREYLFTCLTLRVIG